MNQKPARQIATRWAGCSSIRVIAFSNWSAGDILRIGAIRVVSANKWWVAIGSSVTMRVRLQAIPITPATDNCPCYKIKAILTAVQMT